MCVNNFSDVFWLTQRKLYMYICIYIFIMNCTHCNSENVVKFGKIPKSGKWHQRYLCKECLKSFSGDIIVE